MNKEDMKNFDAAKIEYARLAIKAASVADARKVPEGILLMILEICNRGTRSRRQLSEC